MILNRLLPPQPPAPAGQVIATTWCMGIGSSSSYTHVVDYTRRIILSDPPTQAPFRDYVPEMGFEHVEGTSEDLCGRAFGDWRFMSQQYNAGLVCLGCHHIRLFGSELFQPCYSCFQGGRGGRLKVDWSVGVAPASDTARSVQPSPRRRFPSLPLVTIPHHTLTTPCRC